MFAVARRNPHGVRIRTRSPVALPPAVLATDRFVESVDPNVVRARSDGADVTDVGRGWRRTDFDTDAAADGNSGSGEQRTSGEHCKSK
jgi:hypothetical protein